VGIPTPERLHSFPLRSHEAHASLVDFPYVLVRLPCDTCKRAGSYRLARLAVKYGAEILLDDLLVRLSADCPWRDDRRGSCGARFADMRRHRLDRSVRGPDRLVPAALRLAFTPTPRCHCRHPNLVRTASSICSDMIFGKDRYPFLKQSGRRRFASSFVEIVALGSRA
jgi:hypothetical protein